MPCTVNPSFNYTRYPCDLDTPNPSVDSKGLPLTIDNVTPVKAEVTNRLRESTLAIEGELGIKPSGTFTTVRARLDSLENLISETSAGVTITQNSGLVQQHVQTMNFLGGSVFLTSHPNIQTVDVLVTSGGTPTQFLEERIIIASPGQSVFTLSQTPVAGSVVMYVNGVAQTPSVDYTVTGSTINYIGTPTLQTTDSLFFTYFVSLGNFITVSPNLKSVLLSGNLTGGSDIVFASGDSINTIGDLVVKRINYPVISATGSGTNFYDQSGNLCVTLSSSVISANFRLISNVADPVSAQDAATKNWSQTNFTKKIDLCPTLRTVTGVSGWQATVSGYNYVGDGGGGSFVWDISADTDDGATRFNAGGLGSSSAGWKRIYDGGSFNVKWFGAYGDGSHDDTVAIQAALTISLGAANKSHEVYLPFGTYLVKNTINIGSITGTRLRGEAASLAGGFSSGSVIKAVGGGSFATTTDTNAPGYSGAVIACTGLSEGSIKDIVIDLNGQTGLTGLTIITDATNTLRNIDCDFENIFVWNSGYNGGLGFAVGNSTVGEVDNLRFTNLRFHTSLTNSVIHQGDNTSSIWWRGCNFSATGVPYVIYGGGESSFVQCTFDTVDTSPVGTVEVIAARGSNFPTVAAIASRISFDCCYWEPKTPLVYIAANTSGYSLPVDTSTNYPGRTHVVFNGCGVWYSTPNYLTSVDASVEADIVFHGGRYHNITGFAALNQGGVFQTLRTCTVIAPTVTGPNANTILAQAYGLPYSWYNGVLSTNSLSLTAQSLASTNALISNVDPGGFTFANSGGTLIKINTSGSVDMNTHQINNVVDPTLPQDAATKHYVDGYFTSIPTIVNKLYSSVGAPIVIAPTGSLNLRLDATTINNALYTYVGGSWLPVISLVTNLTQGEVPAGSANTIFASDSSGNPSWSTGPTVSGFLAVKTANPASSTGSVRLAKDGYLNFRNNANGADVVGISLGTSDQLLLGNQQVSIAGGTTNRVSIDDTRTTFSYNSSTGNIKLREWTGGSTYGSIYLGLGANAENNTNYAIISNGTDSLINAPLSGGTVYLNTGGTSRAIVTSSILESTVDFRFNVSKASPAIYQSAQATVPQALLVQAANVITGTGSDLNLTSGTGSVNPGTVNIKSGGTTRLALDGYRANFTFGGSTGNIKLREWTSDVTYAAAYLGLGATAESNTNYAFLGNGSDTWVNSPSGSIYLSTAGSARVYVSGTTLTMNISNIQFTASVSAPIINQANQATVPQAFTVQAANVTTGTGSDLVLQSGTGSVTAGKVNLKSGATTKLSISPTSAVFSYGGSTGVVGIRERFGVTSYGALYFGSAANGGENNTNYTLSGDASSTSLNAPTSTLNLLIANGACMALSSSSIILSISPLKFDAAVTNPTISQQTLATVPQILTIQAANVTTGTGSDLVLTSGTGSAAPGNVNIQFGGNSAIAVTATGVQINKVSGQAPATSAPSNTTNISYVSGGEAACPAPTGMKVEYTAGGANWKFSWKNTAVASGNSFNVPIGTVGTTYGTSKFDKLIATVSIIRTSPSTTSGVPAFGQYAIYARIGSAGAAICAITSIVNGLGANALTVTVGGAASGSAASGGAVVLNVSVSSGTTDDYLTIVEAGAGW